MSEAEDRLTRLEREVRQVKSRRGIKVPIDRYLMIGGGFLASLGVMLITMGWAGAAGTPYVFEQIPYLISGGLLGLALAGIGGLAYFAFWMTRQIDATKEQSDMVLDQLKRIEQVLAASMASSNGSSSTSRAKKAVAPAAAAFVTTEKGSMFHRPDCVVVAGKVGVHGVEKVDDLEPCKICDPLGVKA